MKCAYLAFTAKGHVLAQHLARTCPGTVTRCGADGVSLAAWTAKQFADADALVFVGAVGIAVRAIAPHCRGKAVDPAVVVLDEQGRFAVSLLSGHLGGANDLTRQLAAACHAVPVITTATDGRGIFAVDEWAVRQHCAVAEPERIKYISGTLLAGKRVHYFSDWQIEGESPAGVEPAATAAQADFVLTLTPKGGALHIVPRIAVLGIGCKRGISECRLQEAFSAFCVANALAPQSVAAAASIDLKKDEQGLLDFAKNNGWTTEFYTAETLRAVRGHFTASQFVKGITGVDNVCERAAVKAAGGKLFMPKWVYNGVTFAVALRPFAPDWRWKTDG